MSSDAVLGLRDAGMTVALYLLRSGRGAAMARRAATLTRLAARGALVQVQMEPRPLWMALEAVRAAWVVPVREWGSGEIWSAVIVAPSMDAALDLALDLEFGAEDETCVVDG